MAIDYLFVYIFLLESTQVKIILLVQLTLVCQQLLVRIVDLVVQRSEVVHELKQYVVCLRDGWGHVLIRLAKWLDFYKQLFHFSDIIVLISRQVEVYVDILWQQALIF